MVQLTTRKHYFLIGLKRRKTTKSPNFGARGPQGTQALSETVLQVGGGSLGKEMVEPKGHFSREWALVPSCHESVCAVTVKRDMEGRIESCKTRRLFLLQQSLSPLILGTESGRMLL